MPWVPLAASATLRFISLVVAVCSSTAAAMVAWKSLISPMTVLIRLIASTAPAVSAWMASTRWEMSSVARAVSWASSLTSLATTAKPLPASPARAASMVAFSASRLVCSAMPLISLMTVAISCDESPSLPTVWVVVLGDVHRLTGHPGGLGGVVRDLADRRLHLRGAGGHGVHAGGDRTGGGDDLVGLRRRRSARCPPSPRRPC